MLWKAVPLFTLLAFFAAPALADSNQWSKNYEIRGHANLRVDTSDANIRIDPSVTNRGWGIGTNGIMIEDHQNGDSVDIQVRFPHHWISIGNRNVQIEIRAPRTAVLNLHTGDGGIDVNGITGHITADTGDGHISVLDANGNLHATTGDGH